MSQIGDFMVCLLPAATFGAAHYWFERPILERR
jgi:hypothetical protein